MPDSIGTIPVALAAIVVVGAIIVGGVLWASRRRLGKAVRESAEDADQQVQRPIWRPGIQQDDR